MASRKQILGLGICAALGYAGYDWCEKNVEIVTLHAAGAHADSFPRLFIVDDAPVAWVRAERPDRIWLKSLRENPAVDVQRGDRDSAYHAVVDESDRERVDALFRAKYGVIDRLSAWVWQRDAVPIRLEPVDDGR
jgi:hypothetical protein